MRGPIISETIAKKNLISIRDYVPDDRNFILTTFLRGLYEDNDFFHQIKKRTFFENYENGVKHLLTKPNSFTRVACLKESEDVILGYAILEKLEENFILHWVYTKHLWRKIGIAKDLLAPYKIKYITHTTNMTEAFRPRRYQFQPFLA